MNFEKTENAILRQVAKYAYYWDARMNEEWVDLFTEDGAWQLYDFDQTTMLYNIDGHKELYQWTVKKFEELSNPLTRTHHSQTELLIEEVKEDMVKSKVIVMVTHQTKDAPISIGFSGIYYDTWALENGTWKIKLRTFKP